MKKKDIFKLICFLFIAAIIFLKVTDLLNVSNNYSEHAEMMVQGYYDEPEDTVDAVVIGNSHVYRFWQPAFAWKELGIAGSSISTPDMPYGVVKNVAIEACKTQDPKVLVLDATIFASEKDGINNKVYLLTNTMKWSANYFDMIANFCKFSRVTGFEQLQYYFPILQFHSRWEEMGKGDFEQIQESYLNSCYQKEFLEDTFTKATHHATDERVVIAENCEEALRDLLDWCVEQDREIMFFASPFLKGDDTLAKLNYVCDIIKEYGLNVRNYNDADLFASCGLDVQKHFQDRSHTNVKGSYIFTQVLGQYLIDEYGLEDHRGEELYASWDVRADKYYEIVEPYMNDSEPAEE